MKLLIVDDSSIIRRTIENAYKDSVFSEIETASDGMIALEKFKEFQPDVVTLDITMPHLNGLSVLGKIKKMNPDVSVLTVSALADHHTAIKSLELGAHQFICKPFEKEDLTEALDDLLKDKQTLKPQPVLVKTEQQTEQLDSTVKVQAPPTVKSPSKTAMSPFSTISQENTSRNEALDSIVKDHNLPSSDKSKSKF